MTYEYRTKPYDHQREAFEATADLRGFAFFWEMGTGKSKILIDTMAYLYQKGEIGGALIMAPKAVAPNWVHDEIPVHCPDIPLKVFLWETERANTKKYQAALRKFLEPDERLSVLVMSYDGIMTQRKKGTRGIIKGAESARKLLDSKKCLMILDESARIKGVNTKRSKRVIAAGKHAKYHRVASGTPVSNSPFDVFNQLRFIDPGVWDRIGCRSYEAFKTKFGVWVEHQRKDNGRSFKTLVSYQNLPTLHGYVDQMGSRLLKADVLDLPPKVYEKRYFEMAPKQAQLYRQLREKFLVMLEGGDIISAPLAITRMLRLQQITSGYIPTDDGDMLEFDKNPRLKCLMDTISDVSGQCIIWCKFHRDIDLISAALHNAGITYVVYDGRVNAGDRESRRAAFKSGKATVFLANPAAAGEGLTLTEANTCIYYNSTYKLADRLQSEDRAHRIGQDSSVTYIDIIAQGSIDEKIIQALRTKVDLAQQVMGDSPKEWI